MSREITWAPGRRFRDRPEAGRVLARLLSEYAGRDDVVVLGLPRGGVPVAAEVARALGAPVDAFPVRKLGVPGHEELAMGAVAPGGVQVLDAATVRELQVPDEAIAAVAAAERAELGRRERAYRGERPLPEIAGKTVILVDDGLATGASMRAAVAALRAPRPRRIVVAVPVGSREACGELAGLADEVVCAVAPEPFYAVGLWYVDFSPITDAEVRAALQDRGGERPY